MMGKKPNDINSKDGVVIQRVIREVCGESNYHILTKIKYSDWTLLMNVKLKVRALYSVIEYGDTDQQEEMMVIDALCGTVPLEMVWMIVKKEMMKEA
jgi:hypothetical protein